LKGAIHYGSSLLIVSMILKSFDSLDSKEKTKESGLEKSPLPNGEIPVLETEPTAIALGFHHDAKQTNFDLYPERKSPSAAKQVCKYCAQFNQLNEAWGKCNIISTGVVSSKGWCSAWSQR